MPEEIVKGGLLLVHAHPDDESIATGGTIALYRRRGVPVTVVTCTLGEEGEVIGDQWSQLVSGSADQLGGYRIGELGTALAALGAGPPLFLGGAGRWRDSGMAGSMSDPRESETAGHPRAFVKSGSAAVEQLVEVIVRLQPQVVIGYDPNGGYGHPDHIHAHRITMMAVEEAVRAGWDVPKLYWTVTNLEVLQQQTRELRRLAIAQPGRALPPHSRLPTSGEMTGADANLVTATINVASVLDAKRAALCAHATQIRVSPLGSAVSLSNNIAQPLLSEEHYVLVRGRSGPVGDDGREDDLFAGMQECQALRSLPATRL
ncbi:N-acetyl-1-D-myo-inositol-2-amino-2-deoxy-alpha-D-glucopyranoside deacetylase [Nocardia yamanashiensis]|uniref:N-acetyl-1-D-myo-inositol-2-amino-2-deoxy-alpha- D-glucopyranoside deacetylase n=1 Tax=Nocardia yamanashiensis TaxID=209247 RepID=UPI00082E0376|nr:N-acetyl-1-D-myo-inositol-2-amino-2-deoxy-alpha-D-glucopyranoside deacetylase [Nocardia yamanashiensis]